jgi:hypothetical protein
VKKRLLLGLFIFLLAFPALADIKVANDPTRLSVGARLLGMGKAFAGEADDINSLFINPAGLSNLENWQLTSMQGKFINEVNYLTLGGASPSTFGTFGFGFVNSDLSFTAPALTTEVIDGIIVLPSSTEGGTYSYKNGATLLSFGRELKDAPFSWLEPFSIGATLKLFSQSLSGPGLTSESGSGYDMDVGILYKGWKSVCLGLVVQNVVPMSMGGKIHWDTGDDESLPSVIKLGASIRILGKEGLRVWGENELALNLDYDTTPLRPGIPNLYHLGLEWSPNEYLDVRVGQDQDTVGTGTGLDVATNLTAGVGVNYNGFRFDYAYHRYYDIPDNDTSYFSLSYGIWKAPPPPKIKLRVISPEDKTVTYEESVVVSGEVYDRSIKKIIIQGKEVSLNEKNQFKATVFLDMGKNTILVENLKVRVLRLMSFKDVKEGYWARLPVSQLATLKILTGYPDGTFKPLNTINRAEFSTILVRVKGLEVKEPEYIPFRDVRAGHWAAGYIVSAYDAGIVKGYPDGTFKPSRDISRVEGVVAVARFAELDLTQPVYEKPFPDVSARHWAIKEITAAKTEGLLQYLEGKNFIPNQPLSRGEMAEIVSRTEAIAREITDLMDFEKGY